MTEDRELTPEELKAKIVELESALAAARRMTDGSEQSETETQKRLKGWLTDDEGNPSSIRLLSVASFGAAVAFGAMIAIGDVGTDRLELVIYFIVGAFAPKAVQKFAEKRPK